MEALGPDDGAWAVEYYGVTEKGNFVDHSHPSPLPEQNVLSVVKPDQSSPRRMRNASRPSNRSSLISAPNGSAPTSMTKS